MLSHCGCRGVVEDPSGCFCNLSGGSTLKVATQTKRDGPVLVKKNFKWKSEDGLLPGLAISCPDHPSHILSSATQNLLEADIAFWGGTKDSSQRPGAGDWASAPVLPVVGGWETRNARCPALSPEQ